MLQKEKASDVFEFIKTSHQKDKLENSTLALLFLAYMKEVIQAHHKQEHTSRRN